MEKSKYLVTVIYLFTAFLIFSADSTYAHCDGINGPVVKAARKALETQNINYILVWISKDDESVVKDIFQKVQNVRNLNDNAKELADMYFFENVVRLHRKSEGESYSGLKFSNSDVNPVILAADSSIETESFKQLSGFFQNNNDLGELQTKFNNLIKTKNYNINDVNAGRTFIRNYIAFIHTAVEFTGKGEVHESSESHRIEGHTKDD